MINRIKKIILLSISVLMLAIPVAAPAAVYACDTVTANNIAAGATAASGNNVDCQSSGANGTTSQIGNLAKTIVTIFSYIVGAVAILMIIYGGFRYITSGGDSNGVGAAKNTLIYAIIGLIIVALAQVLVHFVLSQATIVST